MHVKYEYVVLWCTLLCVWIVMCESTMIIFCIDYYLNVFWPLSCYCVCAPLEYKKSGTWVGAWDWGQCYASLVACQSSLIMGVALICNTRRTGCSIILCCISFLWFWWWIDFQTNNVVDDFNANYFINLLLGGFMHYTCFIYLIVE